MSIGEVCYGVGGHQRHSAFVPRALLGVGVALFLASCRAEEPAAEPAAGASAGSQAIVATAAPAGPPAVRFTDVTAAAGIDFEHYTGGYGDKLLPETMGGGVAFLDYDGDGDEDLLLVNSSNWPHHPSDRPDPTMALYRNDGAWSFQDVTREAGLDLSFYGMGAAVADYDADGDLDVFFTAVGENRLARNDGGKFSDATGEAGVAGAAGEWSTGAGFFDADSDGDLDLLVCNYVRWSKEIDFELDFRLSGIGRAFGPPQSYRGTHPYLYRNDGDGTFTDVTEASGLRVEDSETGEPVAKSLALGLADVDGDGRIDVLVANDTVRNFFFHNIGGASGTVAFEEVGEDWGLAYDRNGNATGAMGIDSGFYRNDHNLGFMIGNFAGEMSSVYTAQDDPAFFVDEAIGEGIGDPSRSMLSFGLLLFDYDLDGRLDMLQANGHVEGKIAEVDPAQSYLQAAQLFWNAGEQGFVLVDAGASGDLAREIAGRGAAYADLDADGDLDVVLTQVGGPPLLLRNDQDLGHHRLRVRLVGRAPNRDAIGAWVKLSAGGVVQRRQVMPTRSYLSQVEPTVTFGLGAATRVDSLKVVWPDASEQVVEDVIVDRLRVVEQGGDP